MAWHPETPEEIRLLSEEAYRTWRRHPATKAWRQFLKDRAEELRESHLQRWEQGKPDSDLEAECRGRVNEISDVLDIEFAHIEEFYRDYSETKEMTDETTGTSD